MHWPGPQKPLNPTSFMFQMLLEINLFQRKEKDHLLELQGYQ